MNSDNIQNPQQEESLIDQLDQTRKARQESLSTIKEILSSSEDKLHRKELNKILSRFLRYNTLAEETHNRITDELLDPMLKDMLRLVKTIANGQVNTFAVQLNLKTLVRVLEKRGLITQEEMEEVHNNEILPEELPDDSKEEITKALEDTQKQIIEQDN